MATESQRDGELRYVRIAEITTGRGVQPALGGRRGGARRAHRKRQETLNFPGVESVRATRAAASTLCRRRCGEQASCRCGRPHEVAVALCGL
jgi:hypothetical protein